MQPEHLEVISSFIDDEPFDANALAEALALPEGREQLIDLIALRHIVAVEPAAEMRDRRIASPWRGVLAAAALTLAVGAAYLVGRQSSATESPTVAPEAAPAPARVIDLRPGIEWHQTGGSR